MRILKRNLAFMLAMIMALSLTAFAGYEDYSDVNELTYVEAVDVLTELGIVEGSDGALLPTGNLTRAQAAKLIAYTMLGKKAADALQAEVAPFVDVPTYHWAAGYVEYCADQGIVGGMGDGTFAPEANVTGSQFAKMLLCAVGYGEKGEFTGLSWDSTVNAQGTKLGIFDGNEDNVVFANAVTREEAFLYTFNALTKVMEVTYSADADEYYAGTVFNSIKGFDFDETLGAKLYDLSKKAGEDDFGREGHTWYKGAKKITALYPNKADAVYTSKVKSATIYADLDLTKTTQATVIRNGKPAADMQLKKNLTSTKIGGNGVLVEAYLDEDMDVTLIVVDTYLAQVTDITGDEVDFDVFVAENNTVRVADHETSMDLTEEQYVLVTMVGKEIKSIKAVEEVTGEIDAHGANPTYTEMNETKYNHAENLVVNNVAFDTEMIMMLDEYGYMIGLVKASTSENLDGYVLVTESEMQVGGLAASDKALVEVLHLDGTGYEVLELQTRRTKVNGVRTTQFWNPVKLNEDGEIKAGWTNVREAKNFIPYGFYAYTMTEDGQITLKDLVETKANDMDVLPGTVKANGDSQKLTFGNKSDLVMDNDTVLNMVTAKDVETYEGYKNIKLDVNKEALVIYKGRVVETIYVVDGKLLTDDIVAYYMSENEGKVIDDEQYILLYIDGEAAYYNIENAKIYDVDGKTERALGDGAYVVEMEDGVVTKMTIVKSTWHETVVTSSKAKYFNVEGKNVTLNNVTYADGCKVFDLTEDGVLVDKVAKDDKIIFITKGDKNADVATYIWILKHNNSKDPVTESPVAGDYTLTAGISSKGNDVAYIDLMDKNTVVTEDMGLTVKAYALVNGEYAYAGDAEWDDAANCFYFTANYTTKYVFKMDTAISNDVLLVVAE